MRPGPQPRRCIIQDCDLPPASPTAVFCAGHGANAADGSAATPPIVEPDDPALLEREARKAQEAERAEYAERRRVKTWRTLENGSRVPEEYWSDEELEAIEAAVGMQVTEFSRNVAEGTDDLVTPATTALSATVAEEDPVKAATRRFKRALRGRYGPAMERMAWALAESLQDD